MPAFFYIRFDQNLKMTKNQSKKSNSPDPGDGNSFKKTIEFLPVSAALYSSDGEFIFANKAFYTLWQSEQKSGNNVVISNNLFKNNTYKKYKDNILNALSKNTSFQTPPLKFNPRKNKERSGDIWINTTFFPHSNSPGKLFNIAVIQEDITVLSNTNQILRKNLKEYSVLKDALNLSNIIVWMDKHGIIRDVNDNFCWISEYSHQEIVGKHIYNQPFVKSEREAYTTIWDAIKKGETWSGEIRHTNKSGISYWLDTVINSLKDETGKPEYFISISTDITKQKRTESEISEQNELLLQKIAQRNRELEEAINQLESFTYSVSHDLRAPLRAITGFSGLLKEEYSNTLDDEGKRYIDIIEAGTNQMSVLINDLLNFSHTGRIELQKSVFNPKPMVLELIHQIQIEYNKDFQVIVDDLQPIYGDLSTLRQVFTNLIRNAFKFSSGVEKPEIKIGMATYKNRLMYYIKDNGVGFDMRYADKLFKVFQRLHSEKEFRGSGVGLAIVWRIIKKHGGIILAESNPGKGADFYFWLPGKKENGNA